MIKENCVVSNLIGLNRSVLHLFMVDIKTLSLPGEAKSTPSSDDALLRYLPFNRQRSRRRGDG